MAKPSIIRLEFPENDIAVLTLNDADKGANVLSQHVLAEFESHLDELQQGDDLAGLIIRSTKPGIFIAGADLREFVADLDLPDAEVVEVCRRGQLLFQRLAQSSFVTVAAIDGVCLGGGSELAVWCDRRIFAENKATEFGFPEVKLGLMPGWGGTARTPRIIGLANAIELITGGESVDATEAWKLGLADDLVRGDAATDDGLLAAALRLVRAEQQSKQYLQDRERWTQPLPIGEAELGFLGATASALIQGNTKGHYPAPLFALELMLEAAAVDLQTACQMEAEAFAPLFGSEVNRSLLNVFFLREANKKATWTAASSEPRKIEQVSVVGAGVMGQGIAAACIKRGVPVVMGDVSADSVGRGVQGALTEASYDRATKGPGVERALELAPMIRGTLGDQEIATSDLVVEAIYENADAKRELFARLEPLVTGDAILCSNTSTIPISDLASSLQRPERFCGLHFFNPVRRMPLVEVIRGEQTNDATIATSVAFARRIGKSPIVVGDGPGFLVNRVLMPYMNEALLLLGQGASIRQVDRAATKFGMPMGPITLYDTVGLDVAVHAGGVMHSAFPDRVEPSSLLPAMVETGRLGKKTGGGFFDYQDKRQGRGVASPAADQLIAKHRTGKQQPEQREFSAEELQDRLLMPMLLEATRVLEDGVAAGPRDVDLALIYGIGFPPFRGGLFFWADRVGAGELLERLKPLESLGPRYAPTQLLKDVAASGSKFYD